ncbi:MAG: right-handed parallel beta-helix repeat-containing protein [candidate division Zixibacteria bacterium]|nr:right-handed parallel beta-helix repeat-containing protein [candidate division Zixibacteria bacterium]
MMKSFFKVMILGVACLLISSAAFAQYTEFVVEPGGSSTTYPDLATAVATAQAFTGDHRIVVRAGTYNDVGIVIDHTQPGKIREIVGEGSDVVFFADPVLQTGMFLDVSGATDVTVTGINVAGYLWGMTTQFGPVTDLHVYDCIFDDNGVDGLPDYSGGAFSIHGSDILIEDLEVMNGERGIRFGSKYWDAGHANTWVGPVTALDNITVKNCYIHDNEQYGIYYDGLAAPSMNGAVVEGNTVELNTDGGIQLWAQGATFNGPTVDGNTVTASTWEGIIVADAAGGSVSGNTVTGCSKGTVGGGGNSNLSPHGGIYISSCSGVTVHSNTSHANGDASIAGSEYGMWVSGSSNSVRYNCLFDHAGVQGYDGGDGTNYWTGNYYEDLATPTYTLDGPGVPYEVDGAPWLYNNSAVFATAISPIEVWDVVDIDVAWTIPGCSELDATTLGAYEFTFDYDETKFEFVSAGYNMLALTEEDAFFGQANEEEGALYTGIAVDEVAGTITFAATNFENPKAGDGIMASLSFQAIATGTASDFEIHSVYLDGDANPVFVANTPLPATVEDNTIPVVETLDIVDAVGNNTFGLNYDMEISGTVSDNYDLYHIWYRFDDAGGWNSIGTVDGVADTYGPIVVDLSLIAGDGSHTLNLMVRDESSNNGYWNHDFTLDNTGPVMTDFVATDPDGCADAGWSSNLTVDVSWTSNEACSEWQFYNGAPEGWLTTEPTTYTFAGEGIYALYIQAKDLYGNANGWVLFNMEVDTQAPVPSAAYTVPAGTTGSATFTGDCNLDAAAGALYAKAVLGAVAPDCADIVDLISGLGTSPRFTFVIDPPTDGTYDVTFASMDAAGNVGTVATTIDLDMTATEIDAFAVADATGSECSDNWIVSVTVEWTGTDVKWLHLGSVTDVYDVAIDISAEVSPYTASYAFTNPPRICDDMNPVFGQIEDAVGNLSVEATDDVFVDCSTPVAGTVVLNGTSSTWTANPVVSVDLAGFTADVDEVFMSLVSGDYTAAVVESFAASTTFDFGTPAENTWVYLYVEAEDCADRRTGEVSDRVAFDLTDPILSDVVINGGALTTNSEVLSVDFTLVESNPTTVYISEAADMSGATSYTMGAPYSFTVAPGDGTKEVYVQVEDRVGRLSTIVMGSIELDGTPPVAGTMVFTSGNPLAVEGYTNSLTGNFFSWTTPDDDILRIQVRNEDNDPTTGWLTIDPWEGALPALDDPGLCGPITIEWYITDFAMNQSGPFTQTFEYCPTAPPAPVNATGVPGASVTLAWDAVPDAQLYHIRYNFANEYPLYGSGIPPFPMTMGEGIFEADVLTNGHTFEGPQDDLYAFAIWTLSNHGVWATVPNIEILEHNYRLGDIMDQDENLGSDGCLSFDPEFVLLAVSYNTVFGDAYFNDLFDFSPIDYDPTGIAAPDGDVDFDDLVIFALNYLWSRNEETCEGLKSGGDAATSVIADVTISAEIPAFARAGDEFSVPFSISDGGIAGYHLVFDYPDNVEVVSVDPGTAYNNTDKMFFYYDEDATSLDVSSVILSEGFEAGEIAVVTFRATATGMISLDDKELDVRDWQNGKAEVTFDLAAKGGTLPTEFSLSQNYPNPFNPTTTIELAMPVAGQYNLTIYNVIGQIVGSFEGYSDAGFVTFNWDASEQSSGVYLYRVEAGSFSNVRKMVLLK